MSETGKMHCLFRSKNFGTLIAMVNELISHKLLVSYSGSPQQLTDCSGPSTGNGELFALCHVSTIVLRESIVKTLVKFPDVTVAISVAKGELCQCPPNVRCKNALLLGALLASGKPLPTFKGYQPSTNATPPKSPTKDNGDDDIMDVTPDDVAKANEFRTMLKGPIAVAAAAALLQPNQNGKPVQRTQIQLQQQFLNQQRAVPPPNRSTPVNSQVVAQAVARMNRQQLPTTLTPQQQIIQQQFLNQQRDALARQQQAITQVNRLADQQTRTVRLQPPPLPQRAQPQRSHPYQMPQRANAIQRPQGQQTAQLPQRAHPQVPASRAQPVEKKQHISIIRAQEQLQQQLQQSTSRTPQQPSPQTARPQIAAAPVNQMFQPPVPANMTVGNYLAQQAAQLKKMNAGQSPSHIGGGAIRTVLNRGRPPTLPTQQLRPADPCTEARVNAAVAKAIQQLNAKAAAKTTQPLSLPSAMTTPSTSSAYLSPGPGPSRRFSMQSDEPSTSTGRGTRRKAPADDEDYAPPDASTLSDLRCSSSTRPKRACTTKKETAFYKEEADPCGDEDDEEDEENKKKKGKNDPAYDFLQYRVDRWTGYDINSQKPRKKPPTDEEIVHYKLRKCEVCNEWVPRRQFFNHALEIHGTYKRYRCEEDGCNFQTMFYKKARDHVFRVHKDTTRAFDWKMDNHYRAHGCMMIKKCFPVEKVPIPLTPMAGVLLSGCDRHNNEPECDIEEPSYQDVSGPIFASGKVLHYVC